MRSSQVFQPACLALVLAGFTVAPTVSGAGHPYYSDGHSGSYLSRFDHGYSRGFGYANYGYGRGHHSGNSFYYGRGYGYPAPYYGYSLHNPTLNEGYFPHRPFPFYSPRIYVVPQKPPTILNSGGSRVINVIQVPTERYPSEIILQPTLPRRASKPVSAPARNSSQPAAVDPLTAWENLEDGEHQRALSAFAVLASEHPANGLYKAGYGLAAALAGDKLAAGHALRRAFETDPEGASFVPASPALKVRLRELIINYRKSAEQASPSANDRFLLALTSYLVRDDATARRVLADAIADGDQSAGTANLANLLEAQASVRGDSPPVHRVSVVE